MTVPNWRFWVCASADELVLLLPAARLGTLIKPAAEDSGVPGIEVHSLPVSSWPAAWLGPCVAASATSPV